MCFDQLPELLTVREAAEYARVDGKTIRRAIWARRLKASRVGRAIRINKEDLRRYLETGASDIDAA